jgi:hypothetical protein
MGFSGSPPPYLSLMAATAANSSSEVTRNTTMAAYMSGANFASAGSGLLDSTVSLSLHLFSPCIMSFGLGLKILLQQILYSQVKNHAPVSD